MPLSRAPPAKLACCRLTAIEVGRFAILSPVLSTDEEEAAEEPVGSCAQSDGATHAPNPSVTTAIHEEQRVHAIGLSIAQPLLASPCTRCRGTPENPSALRRCDRGKHEGNGESESNRHGSLAGRRIVGGGRRRRKDELGVDRARGVLLELLGKEIALHPTADGKERYLTAEVCGDYAGLLRLTTGKISLVEGTRSNRRWLPSSALKFKGLLWRLRRRTAV